MSAGIFQSFTEEVSFQPLIASCVLYIAGCLVCLHQPAKHLVCTCPPLLWQAEKALEIVKMSASWHKSPGWEPEVGPRFDFSSPHTPLLDLVQWSTFFVCVACVWDQNVSCRRAGLCFFRCHISSAQNSTWHMEGAQWGSGYMSGVQDHPNFHP